MLSTPKRIQIEKIILRISRGEQVTLGERLYVENIADNDPSVAAWLKRALRLQENKVSRDTIDTLLNKLDLGSPDPRSTYQPEDGDLGEWFSGAPSWLARS